MSASTDSQAEPAGFLIGSSSRVVRFIQKVQLPVVAIGRRRIHHFVLHGEGFELPLEGQEKPLLGFYVNVWVAATDLRNAESRAVARIRKFWSDLGYEADSGRQPKIEVEESSVLPGLIRRRWRSGFAFYSDE